MHHYPHDEAHQYVQDSPGAEIASVTVDANAQDRWAVNWVAGSNNTTGVVTLLQLQVDLTVVLDVNFDQVNGPLFVSFPVPVATDKNQDLDFLVTGSLGQSVKMSGSYK